MSAPLLKTKLYIPPVRPGSLSRPHLLERLNQSMRLGHRLVLLSAPAGFGKTTLLSEWIAQGRLLAGWISLDEKDNDPARFLSYLAAALQAATKAGGSAAPPSEPSQPIEQDAFLSEWVNRLHNLSADVILVLDDYHLITAERVHEAVTFLLDYAPPGLHLAIASRADPPLPVARLRGRGQVTELRQRDLRFTARESAAFLEQRLGRRLQDQDVGALAARTEGWIAGLQMAAQSLQGREDQTDLVRAFAGSHRYILDYLLEEVLYNETADVQRFLLHTSILDQLCGPLCDAVLGRSEAETGSSQAILEHLERANLFVVPLDDHREWYRYHRLFADLLRHRLAQAEPERAPILHHQASCWYQARGMPAQAIDHALQGPDLEWAADLIDQHAEETILRGEMDTVSRWMDLLPRELAEARPSLFVSHALVLLLSGRPIDELAPALRALESDEAAAGGVLLLRALIALMRGHVLQGSELANRALTRLSAENRLMRGIALSLVDAIESDRRGRLSEGSPLGRRPGAAYQPGEVMIALTAKCGQAEMSLRQGQLHHAQRLYREALHMATTTSGRRLPIAGQALIGLADIAREWNRLDEAVDYAEQGVALSQQWSRLAAIEAHLALARIQQARGELDAAQNALGQAREIAVRLDVAELYVQTVSLCEARLWIAQRDPDRAWRWARERGLDRLIGQAEIVEDSGSVPDRMVKYELAILARLLILLHRPEDALSVLDAVLPTAQNRNRPALTIEIHTLQALAYSAVGDLDRAVAALGRALSAAEPEGYLQILLDLGQPLAGLLREAVRRDVSAAYAHQVLAALNASPPPPDAPQPAPDQDGLIEPLSDRELSILRLLNGPLSSTEIAGELFISPNTVRYHIKHIYGKLGAHSRSEAVDRARELGIL